MKRTLALCLGVLLVCAGSLSAQDFSWQEQHAKILPTGNLEWQPQPFEFKAGPSVRYIDFENGDDNNDGLTKQAAWKHHPWDKNATALAKAGGGVHTYVFKNGVVYRGGITVAVSGMEDNPIRFTADPSWGEGKAMFYGSVPINGGWKKAGPQDRGLVPANDNLWYVDVGTNFDGDKKEPFSAMFMVQGDEMTRLHIARDSNYNNDNPLYPVEYWKSWDQINGRGNRATVFAKWLLGKPKDFLDGAIVWTQHKNLMGSVHRVSPKAFDPTKGSLRLESPGGADYARGRGKIHYFIENVPELLDGAGEYYYDNGKRGGNAGRLYLIPPEGIDPNTVTFEAAQVRIPIGIYDKSNVEVSNLVFRFNDPDDGTYGWPKQVGLSPCVRAVGNCENITVANCVFEHVANAVVAFPRPSNEGGPYNVYKKEIGEFQNDVMDNIVIRDNDIQHAEKMGAIFVPGASEKKEGSAFGKLGKVRIMRNRVYDTGFRPSPWPTSNIPAIESTQATELEIAGNIVSWSWGCGIFTLGGKGSGAANDVPLIRYLVYQNQIDYTMLGCNDYGGLEHFQGGPYYVFNNITRNCVGTKTFTGTELGYNLYLDGGFKCYSFNNIIGGYQRPNDKSYYSHCGYFMVFGFMDQLFNNTIYRFEYALNGSSGNRSNILGNLMLDCSKTFIGQNRPGDVSMMGGGDTGEQGRRGIPTMSYASNVFYGDPKGGGREGYKFGFVGGNKGGGQKTMVYGGNTLEELSQELKEMNCRLATLGWHVDENPLADPDNEDYRPDDSQAVKDRGVKYFVPWSVGAMVGEWNFFKSEDNPGLVLGEHFYMQPELRGRGMYYDVPRNDLTINQATAEAYVEAPLEDWIEGGLVFDGTRFASLSNADMYRNQGSFDGSQRKTPDMDTNNFMVEAYFKTEANAVSMPIATKFNQKGYALGVDKNGNALLALKEGGNTWFAASADKVNDGEWHHVLAEVDRKLGEIHVYVDGKLSKGQSGGTALAPSVSIANPSDFMVGKETGSDQLFKGTLDFLRVARSTLADSNTTIDELYAWEFDGPQLKDFAGNAFTGDTRDAGALELK